MNWRARLDAITDDHVAALHGTEVQLDEIDAQARNAMERVAELVGLPPDESEAHTAWPAEEEHRAQVAEAPSAGERMLSAARRASESRGDDYVLPSDWTDEDEARMEGYGPPKSWLV
ncbi:hypothetical protein [Nocardia veterana]|uniref:Uncharacterized protein n=1 Tax=Nocardia veterana TaxID=132249 RepID=A0A7X6LXJ8_9NOCA|nr:hypothetical protein [Nocardia veterana]NKY86484.1 hypothetical protein [Nocardia veterana]